MSILPKLFAVYRAAGLLPLNGFFEGSCLSKQTIFKQGDAFVGTHGISLQETMLIQDLAGYLPCRKILVIGNAHGWSTLALALAFPDAKVVAMDPDSAGNRLTNALAEQHGLNAVAIDSRSPDDIQKIVRLGNIEPIDLVFIDANHTSIALSLDFMGCLPHCHRGTLFLLHDVVLCDMLPAVRIIRENTDFTVQILNRTTTGMAVAYRQADQAVIEYLDVFCDSPDVLKQYREHAQTEPLQLRTEFVPPLPVRPVDQIIADF